MGRVLGIVAEYNPFHNGHFYHLKEAKRLSKADYCICVMSGNFTQRGEPSLVNKWVKAYMALCGGVDLVIELPTEYSISSAENFASGAVKVFKSLGVVDTLAFGAECEDINTLENVANVLYEEPAEFKNILNHELKKGASFPTARENAVMMYLNDLKRYANILTNSNNILAIEYLKALKAQKCNITPIAIKRKDVYYNDDKIIGNFASATAIRKFLIEKSYKDIKKVVPNSTYQILTNEIKRGNTITNLSMYEKEIIYNLRKMTTEEIADLPDVSEGLENAIKQAANECNNLQDLIVRIKSKRYTQTRIQRILLYSLLGINKKMMEDSKKIIPYARVLAFNGRGRELLSMIMEKNPKIDMITSVKKYIEANINKGNKRRLLSMLNKDMFATDVYTLGYEYESKANLDFTNNMVIIK